MMNFKNIILGFFALASLTIASSCNDNDEKDFISSTGVSLSQTTLTMTTGDVTELKATLTPSDATSKYFIWTSSNSKVASVDNFGRVCALTVGKTTITVTTVAGKLKATCEVTVNPIYVTSLSLDKTTLSINEGESATLTATCTPTTASTKTVTWTSSNTDVATVDVEGKITAKVEGTTTVTATTTDGTKKTASCVVTVKVYVPT